MLQAIIILSFLMQEKAVTIIDYNSKDPVPGVFIRYGEKTGVTDVNGRYSLSNPFEDLSATIIGWHSVSVESTTLMKIDTIYLFSCSVVLGSKKPIVKNKLIKRGKIVLSSGDRAQVYYYNRKDYSLKLKVENTP